MQRVSRNWTRARLTTRPKADLPGAGGHKAERGWKPELGSNTGEEVAGLGRRGEDVRVKEGKKQGWLLGVWSG